MRILSLKCFSVCSFDTRELTLVITRRSSASSRISHSRPPLSHMAFNRYKSNQSTSLHSVRSFRFFSFPPSSDTCDTDGGFVAPGTTLGATIQCTMLAAFAKESRESGSFRLSSLASLGSTSRDTTAGVLGCLFSVRTLCAVCLYFSRLFYAIPAAWIGC